MEDRLKRGDANLAAGRVAAALWDYANAHLLNPKAAAPRERFGYVHLRKNPERAQPLFESALELEPNSVSGHIGLGLSMLANGEREKGLSHLERAVELDPKSPRAQAALGVSLDQLGRREEALKHLEAARDLRPHDARNLNNLGVAYLRAGQPERA
ncbi:MAG: tetratricopeptide repeat protein, partial [Deltaproteobacteria bacterium]